MLHLLSSLFFLFLLAAVGTLIVETLRSDGARILAALGAAPAAGGPAVAARDWSARVRIVSSPRPPAFRQMPTRAAA